MCKSFVECFRCECITLLLLLLVAAPISGLGQATIAKGEEPCYSKAFIEKIRFCDWGKPERCWFTHVINDRDYSNLECLVKNNRDPNVPSGEYSTLEIPVILAASWADIRALEIFSRQNIVWEVKDKIAGMTALRWISHIAEKPGYVRGNYFETSKFLIEHGANVNTQDNDGITPLIANAKYSSVEFVYLFLQNGADPNIRSKTGTTALMLAANNSKILQALIDAKADVNLVDEKGWTAVFYAIENTQIKKLEILLENGARTDVKDKNGATPLDLAKQINDSNQRKVVLTLLQKYCAHC